MLNGLKNEEEKYMETTEVINLQEMSKKDLETMLQKKIFQLGMTGLQQNDLLRIIDQIEKELTRRREANISQANTKEDIEKTEILEKEKTNTDEVK